MSRRRKRVSDRLAAATDTIVGLISPKLELERKRLREAKFSVYGAASRDRTRTSWGNTAGSADADLLPELDTIRERSRELNRDDAVAASITQTMVDNVVGTGMRAQSRPDFEYLLSIGATEEQIQAFRLKAERIWNRWCCFAELTGRQDFLGLQELAFRQTIENGESFLVRNMRREDSSRPFALTWDVVESDRVSSPDDNDRLNVKPGENQIRKGVEISARGIPVAYWIRVDHPGDGYYERGLRRWRRIPARDPAGRPNVLHLYRPSRPGQSRGVPFLHPVIGTLDHLSRFQEAALVRERVAACWAAFVTKDEPSSAAAFNADVADGRREDLEPGIIEYLNQGESVTFGNPSGLGQQYEPFVMRQLRLIGAAVGLPYELVAKDFSKSNFSNARAAALESRRVFRRFQTLIISKICAPTWELLLEEAMLRGEFGVLPGADQDFHAWTRSKWVTPGWGWVDPQREIAASQLAIEIGVSTLADEAALQGRDWEEILEQRKREEEKREELGLAPTPTTSDPPPPVDDDEDDDDDEEDEEDTDE